MSSVHRYGKPLVSKLAIQRMCCVHLQNRLVTCAQNWLDYDKNRLNCNENRLHCSQKRLNCLQID